MRFSRENRARMPRAREGNSCRDEGEEDRGKILRREDESFEKRPSRLSPHCERRFVRRANIRREITHRSFADAPDDRGLAVDKCAAVMVPFSGNAHFVCGTNGDRDTRDCYMISVPSGNGMIRMLRFRCGLEGTRTTLTNICLHFYRQDDIFSIKPRISEAFVVLDNFCIMA